MAYLTSADFLTQIREINLKRILDTHTPDASPELAAASEAAVQQLKSMLSSKFDTASIFSKTGQDRNAWLVEYAVSIALYILYKRLPGHKVPAKIETSYKDAIKLLTEVANGTATADLPGLVIAGKPSVSVNIGSVEVRRNL